jgi:uncharacterized protein (DUF952 family)
MGDGHAERVATLLHLTTPTAWREALRAGGLSPVDGEFVHLSTPAQVVLPADRLFHGRRDLVLLAVDPEGLDVRWEPGVHGDPDEMRFPHVYGPFPTSSVLAVTPYLPRPDGGFDAPPTPPERADHAARLRALVERLGGSGSGVLLVRTPTAGGAGAEEIDAPEPPGVAEATEVRLLEVGHGGQVAATATLLLDGATAFVELTASPHTTHDETLLVTASSIAAAAGCDLLGACATAPDRYVGFAVAAG